MAHRVVQTVVTAVLCTLVLVGCGGGSDEPVAEQTRPDQSAADQTTVDSSAVDGDSDGTVYAGELADGSTLVVRLDVSAEHPAVVPFAEFRALTGAEEPTWIVGEITVPEGVDGTGRYLTLVEPGADRLNDDLADRTDGVTTADFACAVMEDWFSVAAVQDQALSDAYMAVYDGPCDGQSHQVIAPGGETTTYVLTYEGEIPQLDAIEAELGNALSAA